MAPAEIENVPGRVPKVHASVVVGGADGLDGQVPVACVVSIDASNPPTEAELREFVSQHLAVGKTLVPYLLMSELPRNSAGEIHRHRFEQMAAKLLPSMPHE